MAETSPSDVKATERLRAYWEHGEGAAKIRWGEPGDWQRCVDHLGKYIADPKGYCNLMHKRVTGAYPGHAASEQGGHSRKSLSAAQTNHAGSITKMATDLTFAYAADIIKSERDENGDLLVYGKATGSDRDLDGQRCDPEWLRKAVPAWFEWANIREMHQPIAAGIGIELTSEGDDWYVKSLCVDKDTANKIEKKVLKGYSIGVKSPYISKRDGDEWIAGGEIAEISYVDRPCLPSAKMMICKAFGTTPALEPVEAAEAGVITPVPPAAMPTPKDLAKRLHKAADDVQLLDREQVAEPDSESAAEPADAAAPEPVVETPSVAEQTTEPEPVTEPELPATTTEVPELDTETLKAAIGDTLTDRAEVAKAALPPIEPGGKPRYPITDVASLKDAIQAFGRAKDADKAKIKAHIKSEAKRLGRSDLIPDNWKALLVKDAATLDALGGDIKQVHDPANLKAILGGLADCMKAELDELLAGDDELWDLSQLLRTVGAFTSWWASEAASGETDPPFTDSGPAFVGLAATPDQEKTAVSTETPAPAVDTSTAPETSEPLSSADENRLTELVKSALASALKPSEERIEALEAQLVKALALPEPGGPVITRTATQAAVAREADTLEMHAAITELLRKSDLATDPVLRKGYRERAEALKAKVA